MIVWNIIGEVINKSNQNKRVISQIIHENKFI